VTNLVRARVIGIAVGAVACVALQPVAPPTVRAATAVAAPATGDRYLVEFEDGGDPYLEAGRLEALGIDVVDVYTDVFDGVDVRVAPDGVDVLRGQPFVTRVEPDYVLGLDGIESSVQSTTDQAGAPWGLDRLDQRSLPLSSTYSYSSSGAGVTAYIIDSGISALHTDFGGRVRSGFTTVADGLGTGDCAGHGTHVAGIVGGQVSGVAKSVSLVAVRVLDCNGATSGAQLLAALDWVIADHQPGQPAVANVSIGGPPSTMLDAGVQALINDGVTVVVAAGNENQNACNLSPARLPSALTVAASTENDFRASFSNFGTCLDLFAPGVNIPSAGIASTTEIVLMSGTSMAAPHATGAAAVLLSDRPTLTPAQVAQDLVASATVGVIANPVGSRNALLFSSPSALPVNNQSFVSLVPARLLESRTGPGLVTVDGLFTGLGVRAGGSVTELNVAGRGGVAADASAVVLTVTVTQPAAAGFITVFPCGTPRPLASNVNFAPGTTVANTVVSGVGTAGHVCLYTLVDTDLVVDVNGYFP
jgi:subtilisin family serine protease